MKEKKEKRKKKKRRKTTEYGQAADTSSQHSRVVVFLLVLYSQSIQGCHLLHLNIHVVHNLIYCYIGLFS